MTGAPPASVEFLGLRTAIYPVRDLAAAKAWWTSILGLIRNPHFALPD